jgi:hypothetical protein
MDTHIAGIIRFGAVVVGVGGLSMSASANMLANPGFEDPVTTDGPPFVGFWEAFTASAATFSRNSTVMPRTGLQSLELIIDDEVNQFAGAFQDVTGLSAGQATSFSGWHKSLDDSGGIEIRIEWRDSINNVEISRTPNFSPSVGSVYEPFQVDAVVPAGADSARLVYAIQSFGGVLNQTVYVDDTSFIPAPSIAALLGVGGLGLARRRRAR